MEEVVRQGKAGKPTRYGQCALASIACPILTFGAVYIERTIHYADLYRSNVPTFSLVNALIEGIVGASDDLGFCFIFSGVASIVGFVFAMVSLRLKAEITVSGSLAMILNCSLLFVCLPLFIFLGLAFLSLSLE